MRWPRWLTPWWRPEPHCPDAEALARSEEALRMSSERADHLERMGAESRRLADSLRHIREDNGFSEWLFGGDPDARPGQ